MRELISCVGAIILAMLIIWAIGVAGEIVYDEEQSSENSEIKSPVVKCTVTAPRVHEE